MEYLYEGNFFDDVEHISQISDEEESDEEESDEDRIDSDVETALYGMIHHSENPSYESFQENISVNAKINSNNNTIPNQKPINSNNDDEVISVDTPNENIITISSDSTSDSEDIKFLYKVKKRNSFVPEVRFFNDKCSSNTYTRKESRNWWEKFVSVTYDNENINFCEEHLQTVSDSSRTELDKNGVLNLKKQFILNEDPWKNNSSKFSANNNTDSNSNNTNLDKNHIFNLKERFSVNENLCKSNSSIFSSDQYKVSNSDNKKLDKNGIFNLRKRFFPNENPCKSNSIFSSDQQKGVSNSDNKILDKNGVFNLTKKFFSNKNSQKNDSSKFAVDQNVESNSSEDIFITPSISSDNISINLSSNSPGPTGQQNGIWHVNYEDFPQSQILRYYSKSMNFACRNCFKRGHRKKDCDQPKKPSPCVLCGLYGHRMNKCLQTVCKRCHNTNHKTKNCTAYMNSQLHCNVCQYDGHIAENCPDIWRRYHLTKSDEHIVHGRGEINTKVYCYNCGRKGHFGHQCKNSRDDGSFATLPFIVKYKSSYSTSESNKKNKNNNNFKKKGNSLKTIQKKKKKKKSLNSILTKNILSNVSANCTSETTKQQTVKNKSSPKFVQSVTDYVNLLHLPKENGKNKKQRKRQRTKTQSKEALNKKPLIIHLS